MIDSPERLAAAREWDRHLATEAEPGRLLRGLTEGTLPTALSDAASAHAESPAVTIDGATATHEELDAAAARLAGWLVARGIRPGDQVLIAGRTSHQLLRAFLGTIRCGATAVPADAAITSTEMEQLLGDAAPAAAFVGSDAAGALADSPPELRPEVVVGLEPGAAGVAVRDATASPIGATETDAPPILAYTSGTTGEPKGAPLSNANLLSSLRGVMLAWRWDSSDVILHALPLSHQHGLGGVIASLLAGSHAVVQPHFDPEGFCGLIAEQEATVVLAVPAIYQRLSDRPSICTAPLRSLRLAVSGSAPLPAALAERVGNWLGELPLERYGSTEAGLVLSNLYEGPRIPGSVGYPLPGIEVRLADEGGRPVPDGGDGEIQIRGPQVFSGYRDNPGATAEAFTLNGWFRSGDVGRRDPADGSISITGRIKEMIISGGLNVFPGEVETALAGAPGVESAAVVGVPSDQWGEEVVAFAVREAGSELDADEVIAHCRERLSVHKCPKRVVEVGEIPVNQMGKVRRDVLTAAAERPPEPTDEED